MKIFVTTSRVPWPLEKGDKLRIYHQLAELNKKHEVILCCLNDKKLNKNTQQELAKICTEFYIFDLNKITIAWEFIQAVFSRKPFQVHYFYQRKIRSKIYELVEKHQPDIIYTQLIRTAEYVKHIHHIPKVLDYMDAFSKGMSRRVNQAKFPSNLILKNESKRLMDYESLIFDYYEKHTIISEQDKKLIPHKSQNSIHLIRNGIDKEFFSPTNTEKEYDLVFTGNMNYAPNIEGAVFLVREIMPLVWKSHPSIKVIIAGANPSNKVKELASKNVIVFGWMDDIRDAYNKSKIFIAPMNIGTGLQNKLLEAMSMNLPCITSKLANNALGAEENTELLIGNTKQEYADHIIDLMGSQEKAENLAKKGQEFIHKNFSWEKSTKKLEEIFKSQL